VHSGASAAGGFYPPPSQSSSAYGTDAPDEFNSLLSAALNQSSLLDHSVHPVTESSADTTTDHLHQVLVQHLNQHTGSAARRQSLPSFNDLSSSLMAGTGADGKQGRGSFSHTHTTPAIPKPRSRSPENSVSMLKRRWGYSTMQRCLLQIDNAFLKQAWTKWTECNALHTRKQLKKLRQRQSEFALPSLISELIERICCCTQVGCQLWCFSVGY
jgi:hypothetical protein